MSKTDSPRVSWSVGPVNDPTPILRPSTEKDVPETEIDPKSFRSIMIAMDLGTIQISCFITSEFCIKLVRPQERVHNPPIDGLRIYEEAMKAGLHLPLNPFMVKLLDRYVLSLAQIV